MKFTAKELRVLQTLTQLRIVQLQDRLGNAANQDQAIFNQIQTLRGVQNKLEVKLLNREQ